MYRTRVTLDSVSVPGDAVTLDVVEGTYRENMASVPQATLDALLYADDTPELPELLKVSDVRVTVTARMKGYTDADWVDIPLTPLWLEQITYETTTAGRAVRISAVDILGRLSNNQLVTPLQAAGPVRDTVRRLLNGSGHTQTVTVAGPDGPTLDSDVYDGDGAAAAVEIADLADCVLRVDDENSVTLVPTPGFPSDPYAITSPTRYTVIQSRGPTKVIVQGRDTSGSAGGSLPRYGTVTRTYTRTRSDGAAGLLRRQGGLQTVLTDVQLLPAPWLTLLDAVKVKGDQAPNARVWAVDLPLGPGPMRLTMRTPEDGGVPT